MILADTSVWIDHLRRSNPRLIAALEQERVVCHPFVVGELACGNLRQRREVLALLHQLPSAATATDAEALAFIEGRSLMGHGIGYIDVHLLASVTLSATVKLWTLDARLAGVASNLGVQYF